MSKFKIVVVDKGGIWPDYIVKRRFLFLFWLTVRDKGKIRYFYQERFAQYYIEKHADR
jgi:hypothetical protein